MQYKPFGLTPFTLDQSQGSIAPHDTGTGNRESGVPPFSARPAAFHICSILALLPPNTHTLSLQQLCTKRTPYYPCHPNNPSLPFCRAHARPVIVCGRRFLPKLISVDEKGVTDCPMYAISFDPLRLVLDHWTRVVSERPAKLGEITVMSKTRGTNIRKNIRMETN